MGVRKTGTESNDFRNEKVRPRSVILSSFKCEDFLSASEEKWNDS